MSNIHNPISRSLYILKNEGPLSFGKKGARYARSKFSSNTIQKAEPLQEKYHYLSNPIFQIDTNDLESSAAINKQHPKDIKSALWFVPYFDHIAYGGIYTIFRFIEGFSKRGLSTTIVIYDNHHLDKDKVKEEISSHFPALADCKIIVLDLQRQKISDLPPSDIAFSTIWMSAYLLLKYNQTKYKYYFIQDYEPLFYEGGSMYAVAESTYRFGFKGIVNTPGLLYAVNQRHGMEGVSFVPAVDPTYYYPPKTARSNKRTKIFFYARPGNPRNAFELCLLIIRELLQRYGDKIEIITAGAKWDEGEYGLSGKITNLGLLDGLDAVGELYRSCDIGCVYMLSKHPSYQPFEFMASGVATVSNNNEDNVWFLQNGYNCLLSEPSPKAMAEKIGWLIDDPKLRSKLSTNGEKIVRLDWEKQVEEIWNYVKKGQDQPSPKAMAEKNESGKLGV